MRHQVGDYERSVLNQPYWQIKQSDPSRVARSRVDSASLMRAYDPYIATKNALGKVDTYSFNCTQNNHRAAGRNSRE
jgi:hypothetical protein